MQNQAKVDRVSLQCRWLLYALVLTLVFEGIVRKLLPSALGLGLFFLKDLICFAAIYLLFNSKFRNYEGKMYGIWKVLFIAFIPIILYTGTFDVKLSVFGLKQYLLPIVITLLVPSAFPGNSVEAFKKFSAFLAFLLIPTTLVAVLQNSLPSSHWLNKSVGGGDLAGFSAAGYLRVSSTFSFTAQYSWFLNSTCVFLMTRFFLPPTYANKLLRPIEKLMPAVLSLMLITGAFITGGRTAVLGCGSCLFLGFLICGVKRPQLLFSKGLLIVLISAMSLSALSAFRPEFFAAYYARSQGTETMSHKDEVQERILGEFTSWMGWFEDQKLLPFLFGNGLGVMSNGSEQISAYAGEKKWGGFWTESDVASTFWEGGLYLAIIWYGFRLYMIFFCFRMWTSTKTTSYGMASSFLLSHVVIMGILGTLGIQPPVFFWWCLCIGAMIAIKNFDGIKPASLT